MGASPDSHLFRAPCLDLSPFSFQSLTLFSYKGPYV